MNNCLIYPCVENSKGEVVESRLFKSLLSMFPDNRAEAWRHYDIATDSKFLQAHEGKLKMDEYGEVEFQSYIESIGMYEPDFPTEKTLNKELHKGTYVYQEAIEKVSAFNRKQPQNSKYIATIRPSTNQKGKYDIFVAQNTEAEKAQIKKVIKDQNLNDRMIGLLAEHGISVTYKDGESKYSTENAERNANGLWQLIEFSRTGKISEHAEEVGHFIVGAMGDSPLVTRLENLLSDEEVRTKALAEEGVNKDLGSNPAREAAGTLVGKALHQQLSNNTLQNLISRLVTSAKKIFGKISGNKVMQMVAEAEQIASDFADTFINDGIPEGEKQARKRLETLYHKTQMTDKECIQRIYESLDRMLKEIKSLHLGDIEKEITEAIENMIKSSATGNSNELINHVAILNLIDAFTELTDSLTKNANLIIDDVNINANTPIKATMLTLEMGDKVIEEARKCVALSNWLRHLNEIGELITSISNKNGVLNTLSKQQLAIERYVNEGSEHQAASEDIRKKKISAMLSLFKKFKNNEFYAIAENIKEAYKIKTANIASAFLRHIYGDRFIEYNAGLLWNFSHGVTTKFRLGDLGGVESGLSGSLNIVDSVIEDDSAMQFLLGSLCNSPDIGGQLIVKAIKDAKYKAQQQTGEAYSELMELASEGKKMKIGSTSKFYVRNEKGELTGDLVDLRVIDGQVYELDWYEFRKERLQLLNNVYTSFKSHEDYITYENAPDTVREIIFNNYVQYGTSEACRKLREFEKEHLMSAEGVNQKTLRDSSKFVKTSDRFTDAQIDWLNEYKKLFNKYKSWLGDNNTMEASLAPQTRGGSIWNTMDNLRKYSITAHAKAIGKTLWDAITKSWSRNTELVNTAAHHNWNCEEFDIPINKDMAKWLEKKDGINSVKSRVLPIYYHKRLKDTHHLDTDLIAATMKFAAMAANYQAMETIQAPLEITREVLVRRKVEGEAPDTLLHRIFGKEPFVNIRINEYVDSQFYGLNYGALYGLFKHDATLAKAAAHIGGRVMTVWYLMNNFMSAGTNALVGYCEIFKDAVFGEDMNLLDFTTASVEYLWRGIPASLESFVGKDWTKMSLFAQKFNALDDADKKIRNYRSNVLARTVKWFNPIDLVMRPYAISEHMMQVIPYMALAKNTKLYRLKGTQIKSNSLWQELDSPWFTEKGSADLKLQHLVFSSEQNLQKYYVLRAVLGQMESCGWDKEEEINGHSMDGILTSSKDAEKDSLVQRLGLDPTNIMLAILEEEGLITKTMDGYISDAVNNRSMAQIYNVLQKKLNNLIYNEDDMAAFASKARLVTNNLHGVYDAADKSILHRSLLGMFLLPFKGYAVGMLQKRFGGNHFNVTLNRTFEGYEKAAIKVLSSIPVNGVKSLMHAMRGLITDRTHSTEHFNNALESIKLAGYTTGAALWTPLARLFNKTPHTLIKKAGLNTAQALAPGQAALALSVIYGLVSLKSIVKALALGEDEDEEIDMTATKEDQDFLELVKEFLQQDTTTDSEWPSTLEEDLQKQATEIYNSLDINNMDFYKRNELLAEIYDLLVAEKLANKSLFYIVEKFKHNNFSINLQQEQNSIEQDEQGIIDLSIDLQNKLKKKAAKEAVKKYGNQLGKNTHIINGLYQQMLDDHVRESLKTFNHIQGLEDKSWADAAYILLNRGAREESAFNTLQGAQTEALSLLSPIPLSAQAIYDIYKTVSSSSVGNKFYHSKINLNDVNEMPDRYIMGATLLLENDPQYTSTLQKLMQNKQLYVEDIIMCLQLSDKKLIEYVKKTPTYYNNKRITASDIRNARKRIKDKLEDTWSKYYPNLKLSDYLYVKSKQGHHQRYDIIGNTKLWYKINPYADLEYKLSNPDQVVRDYNFGMLPKKDK